MKDCLTVGELIAKLKEYPEDTKVTHSIGCLLAEPVEEVFSSKFAPKDGSGFVETINLAGQVASIHKWWEKDLTEGGFGRE